VLAFSDVIHAYYCSLIQSKSQDTICGPGPIPFVPALRDVVTERAHRIWLRRVGRRGSAARAAATTRDGSWRPRPSPGSGVQPADREDRRYHRAQGLSEHRALMRARRVTSAASMCASGRASETTLWPQVTELAVGRGRLIPTRTPSQETLPPCSMPRSHNPLTRDGAEVGAGGGGGRLVSDRADQLGVDMAGRCRVRTGQGSAKRDPVSHGRKRMAAAAS
jgi:hypothetical protein